MLEVSQVVQHVTVAAEPAPVVDVSAPVVLALVEAPLQRVEVAVDEQVVEVAERGAPGAPGSSGLITATAGETLHAHRAVRVVDGLLYHPDTGNPAHATTVIGIALQSVGAGDSAVVRTAGTVTEPSWSWSAGFVFCGDDGQLTQSPVGGWLLPVGRAINATTLDVDVDEPTIRS